MPAREPRLLHQGQLALCSQPEGISFTQVKNSAKSQCGAVHLSPDATQVSLESKLFEYGTQQKLLLRDRQQCWRRGVTF